MMPAVRAAPRRLRHGEAQLVALERRRLILGQLQAQDRNGSREIGPDAPAVRRAVPGDGQAVV